MRLVRGRLTLVHRDLWPVLVRLADRVLAAVHEEHTERGSHRSAEIPFPDWVPEDVRAAAAGLTAADALARFPQSIHTSTRAWLWLLRDWPDRARPRRPAR